MKIGYVMSRFPKLTETFIIREIQEARRQGVELQVYPLIRQKEAVRHESVRELMPLVHYTPFLSVTVLLVNLLYLFRSPRRYLGVLWGLITGAFGSWGLLIKTLILFPESVRIAHKMRRDGISHVHAHFATFPAATALVIKRLTGIPYSFTAHGSDIHVTQHGLARKIRDAEFAVMISAYNRQFVLEKCGTSLADRLVVVHCGIRPGEYRENGEPSSPPGEAFTIMCVASLNPVKGHEFLVEACRQLQNRGTKFVCRLVGDGPLRKQLSQQIRESGLEGRVIMEGMLSLEEVRTKLQECDVFALCSVRTSRGDREGIPVALMEAMATGLPVVASDISGIPELVDEESGVLVPPGDSRAIADALQRLAEAPQLRQKLGRHARRRVQADFDLSTNVGRLIGLWRESHDHRPAST